VRDLRSEVWGMNLLVVLPEGGSGTLVGALLNRAGRPDRLVEATVTSEAGEEPVRSTLLQPQVELQPDRLYEMSATPTVRVEGDVAPGRFVDLSLRFARSAPIDVKVPVFRPEGPYADVPLP
jgi:hypothetical protein